MFQLTEESYTKEYEATLAASSKAARVSANDAKAAWEKESAVFVDLRTPGASPIEGFENIPLPQLGKKVTHLENIAKQANTKNIYFLDFSGHRSGMAVNMLNQLPQFKDYNVRAIDGGILSWVADNGPTEVNHPEIKALLAKLRAELEAEKPNEQLVTQLAQDMGITIPEHEMLIFDEATNDVIENPLVIGKLVDSSVFGKWLEKIKL